MIDIIFALLNHTCTILQAWRVGMLHCARALGLKGLFVSGSPNLSIKLFNIVNISY